MVAPMLTPSERLVVTVAVLVHVLVGVALALTIPEVAIPADLCGCAARG